MKNLVVYFSLEGNTKLIAEIIAKELDADIMELRTKKEFPKKGLKKYFWASKSVIFRENPILINKYIDLNQYDNIFLGSPIWVGTYASPFNTFIRDYKIYNRNIGLFACSGGGSTKKCFDEFKKMLKWNNFVGEIEFVGPLKVDKEKNIKSIKQWIKGLNI
ncbi:flavodoxin family protein [Romboutsia sp. Marseille-P6047]|uniref:flavodoxin family protein n=1 Tax=Romboutsia sp. Marseille-P6047 TaxID=2161817 RepID=UPI000F05BF8E|nr:flavodoxin [Romboutsia sp. Marseille-P6047]